MLKRLLNFIKWLMYEQPSLSRLTLEHAFSQAALDLKPGLVLEIGAGRHNSHQNHIGEDYDYLSINLLPAEQPGLVGDACNMPLGDNSIDNIVMLEVLEHIASPDILAEECRRVLKTGGILIASTRFIHPQHGAPQDYYRFTDDAMARVFDAFAECRFEKLGNRWQVVIDILAENWRPLRIPNRLLQHIRVRPTTCYGGLLMVAQK